MGFDVERFVDSVDEDLKCDLCAGVLEDPVATSCGHVYCYHCILKWVGEKRTCPQHCSQLTKDNLKRLPPLNVLLAKLTVRCVNYRKGCPIFMRLGNQKNHVKECEFKNISQKDNLENLPETHAKCDVILCQKGCGLPLLSQDSTGHECIKALQTQVGTLQMKLSKSEHEKDKSSQKFSKREESLLDRIGLLENELENHHLQALNYERQLRDYSAKLNYLEKHLRLEQSSDVEELIVTLERSDGSLGFNIMGGTGVGNQSTEGILVSRIVENGPASQPGKLQLHDRILKVNGEDLSHVSHRDAVEAIKTATEPISLLICRKKEGLTMPPFVPTDDKAVQTDNLSSLSRSVSLCALPTSEDVGSLPHATRHRQARVQSFDTDSIRRNTFSGSEQCLDDSVIGSFFRKTSKPTELVSDTDSQYHSLPRHFKSCEHSDNTAFENAKNLDSQLSIKRNRNSQIVDGRLHKREDVDFDNNNHDDGYNGPLNTSKFTHILTSSFDIFSLAGESVDNYPDNDQEGSVSMVKVTIEGTHDQGYGNADFPVNTGVDQVYYDPELGYEYEDITLHWLGNKLGLTLSSGGEDEPYAVFVDEVDPQSIAGIDGRLLEGDQILKINEYPIYTLDEAVGVLENCGTRLKLLVARPATNEIQATFLSSEVDFEEVNGQTWCSDALQNNMIPEEDEDSIDRSGDKAEKDSGVGRTDESAKTSEGSEHDISIEETAAESEQREKHLDVLGREILKLSEEAFDCKITGKSRSEKLKNSDKESNKSLRSSDDSKTSSRKSSKGKKGPFLPKPEGKEVFIDGPNADIPETKSESAEKEKEKGSKSENKRERSRSKEKKKQTDSKHKDKKGVKKEDVKTSRDSEIEWKAKVGKDGTVYIRKKVRPSRNRLLRERASKLAEERKGMTTDDDTHTIYMGKYWSKEDRKKHLGKVREARQKKCQQLQKIAEKSESGSEGCKQINIVEMSQRQMSEKQKFDDFVTVEEILTQRNRSGAKGPVLVTTV